MTMITPSYLGETIEYSSLHACRSTLEDPTIRNDAVYQKLFPQAFGGENELYTINNVTRAIAAFERTIVSVNSPYDRYRYGNDPNAISDAAKRGEVLFFSGERTGCFQCHGSWNFNGALRYEGGPAVHAVFQNTGLYNT